MVLAGILLLDKPSGVSSAWCVSVVKRIIKQSLREQGVERPDCKVGHLGTLDPLASGLLVVLVGRATRLAPFILDGSKGYDADVLFGVETDSLDLDGVVTQCSLQRFVGQSLRSLVTVDGEGSVDWGSGIALEGLPTQTAVESAIAVLRLATEQQPPVISAIKVAGKPAYARTRQGEKLDLPARPIHFFELNAKKWWLESCGHVKGVSLRVRCSKGTYIRSLARDLGQAVGSYGTVTVLRRFASWPFALSNGALADEPLSDRALRSFSVDDIRVAQDIESLLLPWYTAFPDAPSVVLEEQLVLALSHGNVAVLPQVRERIKEQHLDDLSESSVVLYGCQSGSGEGFLVRGVEQTLGIGLHFGPNS